MSRIVFGVPFESIGLYRAARPDLDTLPAKPIVDEAEGDDLPIYDEGDDLALILADANNDHRIRPDRYDALAEKHGLDHDEPEGDDLAILDWFDEIDDEGDIVESPANTPAPTLVPPVIYGGRYKTRRRIESASWYRANIALSIRHAGGWITQPLSKRAIHRERKRLKRRARGHKRTANATFRDNVSTHHTTRDVGRGVFVLHTFR